MHSNRKVRMAVATAVSLIALGLQGNAFALGLSEISVKSHLGQPFSGKINVLGASEIKDVSCLKIVNTDEMGNHLRYGQLKLSPVVDDQATLTITTNQVINEPILNFSIAAECESTIQRDYVVLLDPMMTNETADAADEEIAAPKVVATKKPSKKEAVNHEPKYPQTIIVGAVPAAIGKKAQQADKNTDQNIVLHVPGNNHAADNSAKVVSSQPKLSISSGNETRLAAGAMDLRMDKVLATTPDANAPAAGNVEMDDEVTAMNNRLVNLEKQLLKLQQENVALKSDNKLKVEQLEQAGSFRAKLYTLLPFLGGGLLLAGAYFAAGWWRRRQDALQEENTAAIWTQIHHDIDPSQEVSADATAHAEKSIFDDLAPQAENEAEEIKVAEPAVAIDKSTAMEMSFEATKQQEDQILVEEDDSGLTVLDHADVFLSHGRTNLAIQLLQSHLLEHPKQSVTIWLFLLDLLARENLRDVYEKTALECQEHFNVKISEFKKLEMDAQESLESFPRLCEGLQQVWNTMGCTVYLDDLIYNTRLEPRAGFHKNLIEELLLLKGIAQMNADSAQIIMLDEKKIAIKEQKEAALAAKKAEKFQELKEAQLAEQSKIEEEKQKENLFEFGMIEWK
jgi:hypothetical protein